MATIQGEFLTSSEAARAIEALRAAGIPPERIRKWNIIPEQPQAMPRPSSVGRTAAVGYVLGGVAGAALGATLGAARDAVSYPHVALPDPVGVRVVVDVSASGPDARQILLDSGARNIR